MKPVVPSTGRNLQVQVESQQVPKASILSALQAIERCSLRGQAFCILVEKVGNECRTSFRGPDGKIRATLEQDFDLRLLEILHLYRVEFTTGTSSLQNRQILQIQVVSPLAIYQRRSRQHVDRVSLFECVEKAMQVIHKHGNVILNYGKDAGTFHFTDLLGNSYTVSGIDLPWLMEKVAKYVYEVNIFGEERRISSMAQSESPPCSYPMSRI